MKTNTKFPYDWKIRLLNEITLMGSGHTPIQKHPEYWNGGVKWVSLADSSKLDRRYIKETEKEISVLGIKKSSAVLHPEGTVILSRDAGVGKSSILGCEMAVSQHFIAWQCAPKKELYNEYLFYWLQWKKKDFERIATGSTVKTIGLPYFKKLMIVYPPLKEQEMMANLLTTWEIAIEKTERLIAAKGNRYFWLLRELINRGSENNGWEKAKLGTLFEEVAEKVGDRDLTPFSISAGIGFVSQKEKWGKNIAGQQYQNYIRLKKGEFAYNKGNSRKYASGCVYLLHDHEEICVPNVFICFKKKDDAVHSEFYEHYFIADNHARELRKYISSGARSDGLLNLSKNDFFKIRVPFPPQEKQKFIADVLSKAQQEIDLHKKQLAALQKQKSGLMQKLLTGQWRVNALINEKGNNNEQGNWKKTSPDV